MQDERRGETGEGCKVRGVCPLHNGRGKKMVSFKYFWRTMFGHILARMLVCLDRPTQTDLNIFLFPSEEYSSSAIILDRAAEPISPFDIFAKNIFHKSGGGNFMFLQTWT